MMAYLRGNIAFLSFCISLATAAFNANARTNNIVYWGQGNAQNNLLYYCNQTSIDAVALSFMNLFPAQANGYPGTDFGNQCWATVYSGPGYNGVIDHTKDKLLNHCTQMVADIATCQRTYGKKILLTLGGAGTSYQLTGQTDGIVFANQLWGMFGPRNNIWVNANLPRPFDVPSDTNGTAIDGFALAIDHASTDNSTGYIALANRLRHLFPTSPNFGNVYLNAAPQCPVGDPNIAAVIQAVPFDALYFQFYNNPTCSASSWVSSNPNYMPGGSTNSSTFSLDSWVSWLNSSSVASSGAKVYIGLPGSTGAVPNTQAEYVAPPDVARLISAHYCRKNLGGIITWEATFADTNTYQGQPFYQWTKSALVNASTSVGLAC